MHDTGQKFNALESAIFDWYIREYNDENLTSQIREARLRERKHTGAGFFVDIEVPKTLQPVDLTKIINETYSNTGERVTPTWPINGPTIESKDVDLSGNSALWSKDGYINCLEIYAFGEYFKEDVQEFKLGNKISNIIDARQKK